MSNIFLTGFPLRPVVVAFFPDYRAIKSMEDRKKVIHCKPEHRPLISFPYFGIFCVALGTDLSSA